MRGLIREFVLSSQIINSLSPRQMAFRRFTSHKAAVVSCIIISFLALFVIFAPVTSRYGVNQSVQAPPNSFLTPRSIAWLGTDDIGRDLYSRLIYGVRISLLIGLASAIISVTLGALVGAVAGFRGGKFDDIMMRVTDLFLAFPFLVTLLVVRNVLGALPWLRPIIGVILNSPARRATTSKSSRRSRSNKSEAAPICTAKVVSSTSEEVRPWCIQRAAGPT